MNKHEKQSRKKYDKLASRYDDSWDGKMSAKFKQKIIETAQVKDGDVVLDVGCGIGTLIKGLKQKAANVKAYGIDISPQMIEECKKRYLDINFAVSSGEQLNFEDNSVDLVTICCVLHHLHNPHNFFKEIYRILKPNGVLIINDINLPVVIRQLFNWIFSPLYNAGDNKIFSHRKLKKLTQKHGFEIAYTYKKGTMQIVCGKKIN